MPKYIVKPRPDKDFYVYWSTVVDSPIALGTRAEVERWLQVDDTADGLLAERFERADQTGTSAMFAGAGQWDDEGFIVRWNGRGTHEIPAAWLPREALYKWAKDGDDSLLEPLEDD